MQTNYQEKIADVHFPGQGQDKFKSAPLRKESTGNIAPESYEYRNYEDTKSIVPEKYPEKISAFDANRGNVYDTYNSTNQILDVKPQSPMREKEQQNAYSNYSTTQHQDKYFNNNQQNTYEQQNNMQYREKTLTNNLMRNTIEEEEPYQFDQKTDQYDYIHESIDNQNERRYSLPKPAMGNNISQTEPEDKTIKQTYQGDHYFDETEEEEYLKNARVTNNLDTLDKRRSIDDVPLDNKPQNFYDLNTNVGEDLGSDLHSNRLKHTGSTKSNKLRQTKQIDSFEETYYPENNAQRIDEDESFFEDSKLRDNRFDILHYIID